MISKLFRLFILTQFNNAYDMIIGVLIALFLWNRMETYVYSNFSRFLSINCDVNYLKVLIKRTTFLFTRYPPKTAYIRNNFEFRDICAANFLTYKGITDDQWGKSHFNWKVGVSNYHILRTGCYPYIKYHCTKRPHQDLRLDDRFFRFIKVFNLGIPCLMYGLAAIALIKHVEEVKTPKGTIKIYFLYPEDKGSQYCKCSIILRSQISKVFNLLCRKLIMNEECHDVIERAEVEEIITSASVTTDEVAKFHKISANWWEKTGEMYTLQLMNKLRVPFITNGIFENKLVPEGRRNSERPLQGLKVLDAGCGGGFLAEPLARLGAHVKAIDASERLIKIADTHKQLDSYIVDKLTYLHTTIEDFAPHHLECFDVVISSEVIEHIVDKSNFLMHCISCLKPGGSLFVTTISQNVVSKIGVFLSEYFMNMAPKGTHEYDKLISPGDLKNILHKYKCETKKVRGLTCNPITHQWFWIPSTSINYFLHAVKETATVI